MFDDIIRLHQKYAPSAAVYDLVFTHCRIVRDIALQLIDTNNLLVDRELVVTGAMLHDIGVYPLFGSDGILRPDVNYITHGTVGEQILKDEQLPENVWRIAAHHTGVGLTKHDITAQKLPLPIADYLAETDEELLIMYADKFHSKSTPPYFNSYEWYRQDIVKFGANKVRKFEDMADKFGMPDLEKIRQVYPYAVR